MEDLRETRVIESRYTIGRKESVGVKDALESGVCGGDDERERHNDDERGF